MKNILLSFSAIIVAATVTAQQRQSGIVFENNVARMEVNNHAPLTGPSPFDYGQYHSRVNARTTSSGTGRWYNYCDYLSTAIGTLGVQAAYMWNDTSSVDLYGSPAQFLFNRLTSVGMVWDPFVPLWNDPAAYSGLIQITPSNAYTVDSIYINGIYYRNNSKTAPVDTLTIAILYGDGTTPTDLHFVARDTIGGGGWIYCEYGVDTLYYMRLHYDSVHNHADTFNGGFTPVIKQIYLHNTDTSGNYQAVIPVSINVPAGSMPAISLSFKSGDPTFTFGDTVFNNSGSASALYKYGMFRPYIQYEESGSNPIFPANVKNDQNQGEFELLPAFKSNHVYYPHWFLISSGTGSASTWQFPYFAFHANCPTCSILGVNNILKNITAAAAYPNPANNELTVTFSLANVSKVSVSLTNMLGQVVGRRSLNNVTTGKAIFNTSLLADGVYFYTVQSDGERYVNRIVVAH